MAKSFCRLLILVNHALVAIFNDANMAFNAIRENKILPKISEYTVSCTSHAVVRALEQVHFYGVSWHNLKTLMSLYSKPDMKM